MSIDKYNSTFNEKMQFAQHYCPDQESLVARFVEGLPYEYKSAVRGQATLDAAMEEALKVEDDLLDRVKDSNVGEKRKLEGS